jgi:L-rhamnose mutarotase
MPARLPALTWSWTPAAVLESKESVEGGTGPMERHAFVARIKPGMLEKYIDAHHHFPPQLSARYREAGIRNTSIFMHEDLLFLYLESENFAAALTALENDPTELKWQKLMDPMLDDGGYRECVDIFHND